MISYLLNYISETVLETGNADPFQKITVLHRCIKHFDRMWGIISHPRDIAQRLNIDVLVIL
jgi:hypothetical protein